MSALQEQAIHMICDLSDDNVRFLIEIINRLMPPATEEKFVQSAENENIQAFNRLLTASDEIKQYLPVDFEPDKELEEARFERYGNIN